MRILRLHRRNAKPVGKQRASARRSVVASEVSGIPVAAFVMLSAFAVTLGALVIPNVVAIVKGQGKWVTP